ncbi:MAG: hypothetical protein JNJ90_09780 [Saprospiraceae bacterium]|jgi:hypothetical protein|nr:hypothetical protein [Saprospiraceae bacterium]
MFFIRLTLPLVALLALGEACNSSVQPEKKQPAPPVSESRPTPAPTQSEPTPAVPTTVSKPNHFSLDTSRQANQPMPDNIRATKPETPQLTASNSKPKPPGPPGYITQKNVALLKEPASGAATVAPLNQYENVYILETIFTDEAGRESEYPTWYKVERANKQQGWVKGGLLNAGGGG